MKQFFVSQILVTSFEHQALTLTLALDPDPDPDPDPNPNPNPNPGPDPDPDPGCLGSSDTTDDAGEHGF